MTGSEGLDARLERIRARIATACARSGRDPAEVTLVGVSKGQPVERLRAAYDAGLRIFGENRVQEAEEKASSLPDDIEWHLIGPLQSNKAKRAASRFQVVHSIDRLKIASRLNREAAALAGGPLRCLLEVNLGGEAAKHGFAPRELLASAASLAAFEHLEIAGLMAIPPQEERPEAAHRWFAELRALRDRLLAQPAWSGCAGWLSMGMSDDFEIAIEEGATHVRVGTALFGPRQAAP